jgi:cobalamin-dependent methionine synthase I
MLLAGKMPITALAVSSFSSITFLNKALASSNSALADSPTTSSVKINDIQDYMGAFAVTTGIHIEPLISAFEADHDDYNSIMIKAVADRLAEAFTELMHFKLRTELWGYSTEAFNNQQLIQEKFDGIRPAHRSI